MEDIAIDEGRGTPLVPGAHRVVRTLDPAEGPFSGSLVTHGDEVLVRVDAASLGGWAGWRYAGAEHIAAPVDVSRRRGGHDALLPWCTDRVLGYLERRVAAGATIMPGETSTLVVSLLRGLDELGGGVDGVRTGTWWLTDGGRPVFVLGEGADARAAVMEALELMGEQSTDKVLRRALSTVGDGLRKTLAQPRLPRKLTEVWEATMLDVAAPQPLGRDVQEPEPVRRVARVVRLHDAGAHEPGPRLRADRVRPREAARPRVFGATVEVMQTAIAELRARVDRRSQNRDVRAARPSSGVARSAVRARVRPGALAMAGGAAAVVVAGGMLLPAGESSGTSAQGASSNVETRPSPSVPEVSPTPTARATDVAESAISAPGPPADEDPVSALTSLLQLIAECDAQGDAAGTTAVTGGAEGVVDRLSVRSQVSSTPELVDAYGDVAVARLPAVPAGDAGVTDDASSDEIIVVLLRIDEKWLVRDVYDVADQPG